MPEREISPYGRIANDNGERVTAQQLVGATRGAPMVNNVSGASPALFSTAPYLPPGRSRSRQGKCMAKDDTCRAPAIKGTDLCVFHSPGQGRHDRVIEEVSEPAADS